MLKTKKILKMANFVAQDFESLYAPIKDKGGGAYFILESGILKNPRYDEVPEIRLLEPFDFTKIGLQKGKEIYGLVRDIRKLEFLTKPHEYGWMFEELY